MCTVFGSAPCLKLLVYRYARNKIHRINIKKPPDTAVFLYSTRWQRIPANQRFCWTAQGAVPWLAALADGY